MKLLKSMVLCVYSLHLSDIYLTFQGKVTFHGMHLEMYIFIQMSRKKCMKKCILQDNFVLHTFSVFYNFKIIIHYLCHSLKFIY